MDDPRSGGIMFEHRARRGLVCGKQRSIAGLELVAILGLTATSPIGGGCGDDDGGDRPDAAPVQADAAAPDATGAIDATAPDASVPDAAAVDASTTDAGAPDAGEADAQPPLLITMCHVDAADPLHPTLLDVPVTEIDAHLAHGDPRGVANAVVYVDSDAGAGGLGTSLEPLGRATDALALLRCRYRATGEVGEAQFAPGVHTVSFDADVLAANPSYEPGPIIVDFPVRLRGATVIELDADDRPVSGYDDYTETNATFVVSAAPLGPSNSQAAFLVADTSDVTIEGFVLASGHCRLASLCPGGKTVTTWGGIALQAVRTDGFELAGNVVQPGFTAAVDVRGSSGVIRANFASDTQICVACVIGPGRVEVVGNRLETALGGVYAASTVADEPFSLGTQADAFAIEQFAPPVDTSLDVIVVDNILTGHTRNQTAFGVRLVAYGRDTAATVERQILTARVARNRIEADDGGVGASQGIVVDSGFSDRIDGVVLAGTLFVDIADNTLTVAEAPVAVMTARAQSLLNPSQIRFWKTFGPLERGTMVVDSDVAYPDGFRVDHLAVDPLADQTVAGVVCTTDADCSTASYRGADLPGLCNPATMMCECVPGLVDTEGVCVDPVPPDNVVVINGAVIPPGTAIP